MMTTGHVTESLSAYLDGELRAAERARIEAHLVDCADCRAHLQSLRRSVRLVRGLDPVSAPDGFQPAVRARITAGAAARSGAAGESSWRDRVGIPRLRLPWKTAGAIAAVLLIGLFSVNLLRELRPAPVAMQQDQPVAPEGARERAGAPPQAAPVAPGVAPGGTDLTTPSGTGLQLRRVIRTAQVGMAVDDLDAAARRLVAVAEGAGGFVAGSSYTRGGTAPQGVFTLRVPAPRFAGVLEQLEDLGTIESRRISGSDVTEEFVDLSARIRNLERHEQRLVSFMDRATRVSELLAIEQELARVRGEIEQLTGRLRFLTNQVDLATIEVALRQKAAKSGGFWDFSDTYRRMVAAFLGTVRQILAAAERVAVLLSALLPAFVLAAAAWLGITSLRRRASSMR